MKKLFWVFSLLSSGMAMKEESQDMSTEEQWKCSHSHPYSGKPFNGFLQGVNIGGWLVIEPWITPSLFYQFLGKTKSSQVGMDQYTFCEALGPTEGNKQLQRHWNAWFSEEHVKALAENGINSFRIPVGDWMFRPYGPYVGCTDGSLKQLDRGIELAAKYGISVLIDIHGYDGSQNGFDNSGRTWSVKWNQNEGNLTFKHWPYRNASWLGDFNSATKTYTIDQGKVSRSLEILKEVAKLYRDNKAVIGISPVNEPWENTPLTTLKQFYWDGYHLIKASAPHWIYIISDSFKFRIGIWGGFMKGCSGVLLDTHLYQAWFPRVPAEDFYSDACRFKSLIENFQKASLPVIVGEWSLATDNCAMWLNGFNDNAKGYPKVECIMKPCALPYMGKEQPGAPPDANEPLQGPYGTGISSPVNGKCPHSPEGIFEQSDDVVLTKLFSKKSCAFSAGHGSYFWNFRTEMSPRWSYLASMEKGWIPKKVQNPHTHSPLENTDACHSDNHLEDYKCDLKYDVQECTQVASKLCSQKGMSCNTLSFKNQQDCSFLVDTYWKIFGLCEIHGIGTLVRTNGTHLEKKKKTLPYPSNDLVFHIIQNTPLVKNRIFQKDNTLELVAESNRQAEEIPLEKENRPKVSSRMNRSEQLSTDRLILFDDNPDILSENRPVHAKNSLANSDLNKEEAPQWSAFVVFSSIGWIVCSYAVLSFLRRYIYMKKLDIDINKHYV